MAAMGYKSGLSPDAQFLNEPFIAAKILRVQVIKQATALADQPQKSAARMMVFRVRFEMPGQLFDARGKYGDLNFGRAAVVRRPGVALNYVPLAGGLERHQA
jgi:hypothetical protein